MAETLCGSPLYMAPEILKFQKYDAKADLWSVGTILFEMVAGRPPYGGANHVQLLANIERQELRFPSQLAISPACRHLLVALLQRKPATRMGFDDFFADPFVGLPADDTSVEGGFLPSSSGGPHRGSLSSLPPTDSIREEEEEDEEEETKASRPMTSDGTEFPLHPPTNAVTTPTAGGAAGFSEQSPTFTNDRRMRAFSSHDATSTSLRNSRSGNMEVMQTVFGSTSSAGVAGLRRSSRLGRSRRSTSSAGVLASDTSPKLSPQMSPSVLPSPSPRINPFKQMSESPPTLQNSGHHHYPARAPSPTQPYSPTQPTKALTRVGNRQKMGDNALDGSGEYVLVESEHEQAPSKLTINGVKTEAPLATRQVVSALVRDDRGNHEVAPSPPRRSSSSPLPPFSSENGRQVVDIVLLRTQAIAPIAEQLWKLSVASSAEVQQGNESLSANLDSVFSMSSSLSSSAGHALVEISSSVKSASASGELATRTTKKQYVFAAEALALYVKCLRLIQHGILYLRQDPALSKQLTSTPSTSSPNASAPLWSAASRKLSMAYLMEQLNDFLERADQCKKSMASCLASSDAATAQELRSVVISQEELLYSHAIRLGKQGAIKEVLGQTQGAYDHYLQAMLLLESLLLDAAPSAPSLSSVMVATSRSLAADDQTRVTSFLRALEDRLKNVKAQDETSAAKLQPAIQYGLDTPTLPSTAPIRAAGP